MNAAWPWNGYYEVMSPIWMTAHTTQFVDVGTNDWHYIKVGYGSGLLQKGGTYVTLTDDYDISIIIETMDYNHSICHNSNPPNDWSVYTQDITFQLLHIPTNIKISSLYRWESVLSGHNRYLFEKQDSVMINATDGTLTLLNVTPNTVITLTTISTGNKGNYSSAPNKIKFPMPYSDDFDSYSNEIKNGYQPQAKYFSDQAGSFVVTNAINKSISDYAMEQVVPYSPSLNGTAWHDDDNPSQPLTIIGDYNLTDYNLSVSAYIIPSKYQNLKATQWNTSNIMIGLRLGGNLNSQGYVPAIGQNFLNWGYFLQINDNGKWKLMAGASNPNVSLIGGNLNMDLRRIWFNVSLCVKKYTLYATVNGEQLFNAYNDTKQRFQSGWAALSCGWQTCQFDNFVIK
eukprot:171375_1